MDHRPRILLRLLVVQTLLTLVSPFGIGAILKGGESPDWPPDRPVEWVVVLGACSLIVLILTLILVIGLKAKQEIRQHSSGNTEAGHEPHGKPQ